MTDISLYYHSCKGIQLQAAIKTFAKINVNIAIGLLYTANHCLLCRFENNTLLGSDNIPLENNVIDFVYEARVFCELAELRWLKDPRKNNHRAVILSEKAFSQDLVGWELHIETIIDTIPQTYLLWGEGSSNKPSNVWSKLATSRIGALHIPTPDVEEKDRVKLNTLEYLKHYEQGNVAVFDERLLNLEVIHA